MNLYADYRVLPVDVLHKFKVLMLMHKYLYSVESLPSAYSNYFTINNSVHHHHTRSSNDFHQESSQTSFGMRSLRNMGPTLWNSLPITLKAERNYNFFENKLRDYLILAN